MNANDDNMETEQENHKEELQTDHDVGSNESNKVLRKELKRCKDSMKNLEDEYKNCLLELRRKTSEAENLKTEFKDLQQIINLEEELNEKTSDPSFEGEAEETKEAKEEELILKMKRNGSRRVIPQFESSPCKPNKKRREAQPEIEYNCNDCDYQGSSQEELSKHIRLKHNGESQSKNEPEYNCDDCEYQGSKKEELSKHIRLKHKK